VEHTLHVRRWELWVGDGCHAFFPDDNQQARRMAQEDGLTFSWATTASSANDAARALYTHLGWGEYRPMLRADGTPYPADEHDSPSSDN
jgi:hypothetical protein